MEKVILIDGDILAFEGSFSAQETIQWKEDLWTIHGDTAKAKCHILDRVSCIQDELGATQTIMAFSHPLNFRKKLNPTYKSNRAKSFRPIMLNPLRDWMKEEWESYCWEWLEADDVLGILATERPNRKDKRIIVSIDKDFNGVPCDWYNYKKKEMNTPDLEAADRFHLIQAIAGDAVDGYKGIPKFGPKTAEKHLDANGYTWSTVSKLYESKGLSETEALMNAWMARLLRKGEYNLKQKQIEYLWMPDSYTPADKRKYSSLIHQVTGKQEHGF